MTTYQWATFVLGALGFLITWTGMWFGAGRFVEQMRAEFKKHVGDELEKIIFEIKKIEKDFHESQRDQDHNFGEVGAAMRQFIANVEKKVHELEIYGRDNYLKIPDFERALERISSDFKSAVSEIKDDIRELLKSRSS